LKFQNFILGRMLCLDKTCKYRKHRPGVKSVRSPASFKRSETGGSDELQNSQHLAVFFVIQIPERAYRLDFTFLRRFAVLASRETVT
jgi:hypothetical protein